MMAVYQLKLVYFHTLLNHGAKHPIVGGFPCAFSTTLANKLGVVLRSGNQCAWPLLYSAYDEIDAAVDVLHRVIARIRSVG